MIVVKQVILSTEATKGEGTETDPIRTVTRVFDMTGKLLYEIDPLNDPSWKPEYYR